MSKLEEDVAVLLLSGGVLVGSRAFGVHTDNSDYDIAILENDIPDDIKKGNPKLLWRSMRFYLPVAPMGNAWLIKLRDIDILVYESPEEVGAIRDCVRNMQWLNKDYLKIKSNRVKSFEMRMIETGLFKRRS